MANHGSYSRIISTGFTRPANTTAYAAGDVVCDSTSAPTILTFSDIGRYNGDSGLIIGAHMVDSVNQAVKGDFDLLLFDATITMDNDNAAFTPTDAEMLDCIGVIKFLASNAINGDAAANLIYMAQLYNSIVYQCGSSLPDLYGVLVARNAYTPASAEVFTIGLRVVRDA